MNVYATNEPTPIFTLKKPDGEEVKTLKSFENGEIYPDKTTLVMEFNREKECLKKYMILKNAVTKDFIKLKVSKRGKKIFAEK